MLEETTRRLTAELGPPEDAARRRWRIAPADASACPVTVLLAPLTGAARGAAAWVFAPSDPERGILQMEIRSAGDIDRLIAAVRAALGRGGA